MHKKLEDKLEQAIMRYVDGLDIEGLVNYVTNDLWEYYTNSDTDSVFAFIDEMEIDDA